MQDGISGGALEAFHFKVKSVCALHNAHTCGNLRIHDEVNFKLSVHTLYSISGSGPVICHSKIQTIYPLYKIIKCNQLTFNLFEFSLDSFDSIHSCRVMASSCKVVTSAGICGITLELSNGYKELSCTDSTEHW